jgi:hypothetical protein
VSENALGGADEIRTACCCAVMTTMIVTIQVKAMHVAMADHPQKGLSLFIEVLVFEFVKRFV